MAWKTIIVEPAGNSRKYDPMMPSTVIVIFMIIEYKNICLKLLANMFEETAGKIMNALINSVPMVLTPMTITVAVKMARA